MSSYNNYISPPPPSLIIPKRMKTSKEPTSYTITTKHDQDDTLLIRDVYFEEFGHYKVCKASSEYLDDFVEIQGLSIIVNVFNDKPIPPPPPPYSPLSPNPSPNPWYDVEDFRKVLWPGSGTTNDILNVANITNEVSNLVDCKAIGVTLYGKTMKTLEYNPTT